MHQASEEHVTIIGGEIQTWQSDANFSNIQIRKCSGKHMLPCCKLHVGDEQSEKELSDAFVDHLLRELGEDTVSAGSMRKDTVGGLAGSM